MKLKNKYKAQFILDFNLIASEQAVLVQQYLTEERIKHFSDINSAKEDELNIIFIEKRNIRKVSHIKNKILVIDFDDSFENSNTFKLNYLSLEDVNLFFQKMLYIERNLDIKERVLQSDKIVEAARKQIAQSQQDFSHLRDFYLELLSLEGELLKELDFNKWNELFKGFTKKCSDLQQLALLTIEDLYQDDLSLEGNSFLFHLSFVDKYLYIKLKPISNEQCTYYLDLIYSVILHSIERHDQRMVKDDGEVDLWKKIFSKIPYPMAVISSLGELLIYNESFAKIGLLPKECLRFKNLENAEINHEFYKVRRIDFSVHLDNVSYFVFYTASKESTTLMLKGAGVTSNVDDLGIISSSIAHELNNPLAGILAALSLLSLEDGWQEEELSDLDDMKNGAKRCKELVEIFLGFSKFSPKYAQSLSIKESLDQAINLLRYRMIESNLRIEMKFLKTLESFEHPVNSSVMSMIFYLICSELMTAYAHHRLVKQTNAGSLNGEILEFANQIVFKMDEDFKYEDKIAQSKLVQHLLLFENLEINFLTQEMRLTYRER